MIFVFKEPRSKRVANLKKQIAQVRRSITKNLSNSSLNQDESLPLRTTIDESSKMNNNLYKKKPTSSFLFSSGNYLIIISQCFLVECNEKSIRVS